MGGRPHNRADDAVGREGDQNNEHKSEERRRREQSSRREEPPVPIAHAEASDLIISR